MEAINTFESVSTECTVSAVISQLRQSGKRSFPTFLLEDGHSSFHSPSIQPVPGHSSRQDTHVLSVFPVYFLHLLAHENFIPIVAERMRANLWGVSSHYHCSEEDTRTCRSLGYLTEACCGTVLTKCSKPWNPSAIAVEPRREPRWATRSISDRLGCTLKYPNLCNSP